MQINGAYEVPERQVMDFILLRVTVQLQSTFWEPSHVKHHSSIGNVHRSFVKLHSSIGKDHP